MGIVISRIKFNDSCVVSDGHVRIKDGVSIVTKDVTQGKQNRNIVGIQLLELVEVAKGFLTLALLQVQIHLLDDHAGIAWIFGQTFVDHSHAVLVVTLKVVARCHVLVEIDLVIAKILQIIVIGQSPIIKFASHVSQTCVLQS